MSRKRKNDKFVDINFELTRIETDVGGTKMVFINCPQDPENRFFISQDEIYAVYTAA